MPGEQHQDIPVNVKLLAGSAKLQQVLQLVIDLRKDRDELASALHVLLIVVGYQIRHSAEWNPQQMKLVEAARKVSNKERKPPCDKPST